MSAKRQFRPGVKARRPSDDRTGTLVRRNAGYAEWLVRLDEGSIYPPQTGKAYTWWNERDMEITR